MKNFQLVKDFKGIVKYLDEKYNDEEDKLDEAERIISECLSDIYPDNKSHRVGTKITRLFSSISVYYLNLDDELSNIAIDEYHKALKEVIEDIDG